MPLQPVDLTILNDCYTHAEIHGIPYKFGGKAPSLDCDSAELIKGIDCSGFTRWIIARATEQKVIIPDGSVNQHDWCSKHLKLCPNYKTVNNGEALYISFIPPAGHIGHVWLVRQNWTRESRGGVGVSSRPWNSPVLVNNVTDTYILPSFR